MTILDSIREKRYYVKQDVAQDLSLKKGQQTSLNYTMITTILQTPFFQYSMPINEILKNRNVKTNSEKKVKY